MKYTLLMLTSLLCLTSCHQTNVHQVVKEIAEQPVDTSHYNHKEIVLPTFTAVEVNCFADVAYHQCNPTTPHSVRILAPQKVLKQVTAHVDDEGTLMLTMNEQLDKSTPSVPLIHIYAPAVNAFEVNGGKCLRLGQLQLHSPLQLKLNGVGSLIADRVTATSIEAELNGMGNMSLNDINTPRLKARLNGTGHITLKGKANNSYVHINGPGKIDTSKLTK